MLKYFLNFVLGFLKKLFLVFSQIISYVLNNNFSYAQLSFVFLLQKNSQFDPSNIDAFFLFLLQKYFYICLEPFSVFFLFLFRKILISLGTIFLYIMFNSIIDETFVFRFQYHQIFYFFPFLYMLSKIYLVFKFIISHYFLIQETGTSKKKLFSYVSGSNLQSLENEETSYILRNFSTSSLKSPSFLGEPLGFFITFFSDVFIFLCFHFFMFSFLLIILGV